jgi:urease subunit alpha
VRISRAEYIARYGPTVDDRIRLGDTDLWIRVEDDLTALGDEPHWGYGKTLRSGMTQQDRATRGSELDVVIGGVVVVDPLLGILRADIGIKDGRIVGVGRAGNPDITQGIELPIGPNTWPIPARGLIATAGAIDSHVHLLSPRLVGAALSAGITTLITAGFEEPPARMLRTLEAFEDLPVNVGLQASARTTEPNGLQPVLEAGAVGLKIHEDWGAYPEVIDATLRAAEAHDVAVCLHTDGLNESCDLGGTVQAIDGRTVHAYHVEGAGGGHVPDLIGIVGEPNVICSSTTPTLPFTRSALDEHPDMILIVHEGNPSLPEDVSAARERVRSTTMSAEGPLHELGAISIVNSDSQGMGRIGETVRRTWQLADAMKRWRAAEGSRWTVPVVRRTHTSAGGDEDGVDDNERVLRYLAKITVEPAIVHGIGVEVGSLSAGRMADIVLWSPSHFGVRPALVIKAGVAAWGPIGEPNASVHLSEPTRYGADWGGTGRAGASLGVTFVSRAAEEAGIAETLGTRRRVVPVRGTRGLRREDLVANTAVLPVEVSLRDGRVSLNGWPLRAEPIERVPLSRLYLLG